LDKAVWYVFLRTAGEAVCGAVLAPPNPIDAVQSNSTAETGTIEVGTLGALMIIGGGRFLPTGAETIGAGARRIGTGSTSNVDDAGEDVAPGSCKALKFLFFRIGLVGDAI